MNATVAIAKVILLGLFCDRRRRQSGNDNDRTLAIHRAVTPIAHDAHSAEASG